MTNDDSTEACRALIYRAATLTDYQQWDDLADLFEEDGILIRPSDPGNPIVGRSTILASFRSRPRLVTRHLVSNVLVTRSADIAHVSATVMLCMGSSDLTKAPQPLEKILVGNFEDDLKRFAGGWRFFKRVGSMALELNLKQFQLHG